MYKQKEFDFWKHKAFFAFSSKQLEDAKKKFNISDDEQLVDMNMWWLICVKKNAKEMLKAMNEHYKNEEERRKKEEWKEKIIKYELANYECYLICDISEAVERVKAYWYTYEDVKKIYDETKDEYNEIHW